MVPAQDPGSEAENGLWTVAAGAWARTSDTIAPGLAVFVQHGTVNGKRSFMLTTPAPIVVGSTDLSFVLQQSFIDFDLWGAAGNGTSDDSTFLASALLALAAGGTLSFGPKTYGLNAGVVVAQNGITLLGQNGATTFKALDGSDFPWLMTINVAGTTGLTVENVTFDANHTGRTSTGALGGVFFTDVDGLTLRNVTATNTIGTVSASAVGIAISDCENVVIDGIRCLDCGTDAKPSDGLYITATNVVLSGYIADTCHDHGLVFERCDRVAASDIVVYGCGGGIAATTFGNVDHGDITIDNFVIVTTSTSDAAISYGCFGATDTGNLNRVKFSNGLIDKRVSTNAYAAILGYAAGVTTAPAATAVTGATNTTPIVITANSHGYSNGDVVWVFGVRGNEAANGQFVVANKTLNTFELTGSVGSGAYTASSGFTSAHGRTVGLTFDNASVIGEGNLSQAILLNGVEDVRIRGGSYDTEAPPIQAQERCGDIEIEGATIRSGAAFSVYFADGAYRVKVARNTIRGLDGATAWGIYFAGTNAPDCSTPDNITGSSLTDQEGIGGDATATPRSVKDPHFRSSVPSLASTALWPAGSVIQNTGAAASASSIAEWVCTTTGTGATAVFTPRYVQPVDQVNAQTAIAGAKTWTAAATFSSTALFSSTLQALRVGIGEAPHATIPLSVLSPGSDGYSIDITNPGSGKFGIGFFQGVYGGIVADTSSSNGMLLEAFSLWRVMLGTANARVEACRIVATANSYGIGIGIAPTAKLHPNAQTASAETAPLKFVAGSLMSAAEDGAWEYATDALYFTVGSRRDRVATGPTAITVNIPATALTVGQTYTTAEATLTGAAAGDFVGVSPSGTTPPDDGTVVDGFVSNTNKIKLRLTCVAASITTNGIDYKVRLIKQ